MSELGDEKSNVTLNIFRGGYDFAFKGDFNIPGSLLKNGNQLTLTTFTISSNLQTNPTSGKDLLSWVFLKMTANPSDTIIPVYDQNQHRIGYIYIKRENFNKTSLMLNVNTDQHYANDSIVKVQFNNPDFLRINGGLNVSAFKGINVNNPLITTINSSSDNSNLIIKCNASNVIPQHKYSLKHNILNNGFNPFMGSEFPFLGNNNQEIYADKNIPKTNNFKRIYQVISPDIDENTQFDHEIGATVNIINKDGQFTSEDDWIQPANDQTFYWNLNVKKDT